MRTRLLAALVSAAALFTPGLTSQSRDGFRDLVVFGDSLSDDGNYFALTGQPSFPYWHGRFSNGPVWVEQMAAPLGLSHIEGHAVAGATTTDILAQVLDHVTAHAGRVSPDALYVVWGGANDLIDLLGDPTGDPAAVIQNAMVQTASAITALRAAGARTIMVPNLPDLGATPLVRALGPAAMSSARALAQAYDAALADTLAHESAVLGVDLLALDVFAVLDDVLARPAAYELMNTTDPALTASGVVAQPNTYLFWDDTHPTMAGHALLRAAALRAIGHAWPRGI